VSVGGHLALSLHSPDEPGELLQCKAVKNNLFVYYIIDRTMTKQLTTASTE